MTLRNSTSTAAAAGGGGGCFHTIICHSFAIVADFKDNYFAAMVSRLDYIWHY